MNPYDNNPFPSQEGQQAGGELGSDEYNQMMQMRLETRDSEHLNLLAIFHYVWAGLVALGAIACIGYIFLFGTIFSEAMKTMPVSHPSAGSSSAPATSSSPVSPAPVTPAAENPTTSSGGSGTSVTSSPTSTTYTTSTTPMPAHVVDSMMSFMYILYGVLAGFCLIGAICNFLSARFMQKRKHRVFSMVVGAINLVMFPLGTVLGVFTFIVLCRQSVAQKYTPVEMSTQIGLR